MGSQITLTTIDKAFIARALRVAAEDYNNDAHKLTHVRDLKSAKALDIASQHARELAIQFDVCSEVTLTTP